MGYRVVVAGATGNVGREMVNILAEREFPADEIALVASSRSTGDQIEYGETGKMLTVKNIEHFDPTGWDIALFAIGSEATKVYAPRFAAAGCTVIDNSSLRRRRLHGDRQFVALPHGPGRAADRPRGEPGGDRRL